MTHAKLFSNQTKYKDLRKLLRAKATTGERLLWWRIKNKQIGHLFRRQFNIENYIVDFCCVKLRLIIEIDGYSHENIVEEIWKHCKIREQELI